MRKNEKQLLEIINKITPILYGLHFLDCMTILSSIITSILVALHNEENLSKEEIEMIKTKLCQDIDARIEGINEKNR